MLKMVDGTGIIGLDMVCPLGVSTPQPPNYDKVELEGTGMLVLPNSLDAPLERLELGGKTEQVQTTGAQLWKPIEDKTVSGVEITTDKDGVIHLNGTSLDSANVMCGSIKTTATCTLSCVSTGTFPSNANAKVSAGVLSILNSNGASVSVTGLVVGDLRIRLEGGFTYNDCTLQIMLHEGSTALPYEPYTGGKPSPSPEYPQEIKNSGKWNEDARKYEVGVKVTGKNLLNLQKEPDVKGTYQGWKCGNGESLTLSLKDKGNNADIKGCYIGFSEQGSEPNGIIWVVDNGVIKTNPLTQKKAYVSIFPADETTIKKLTERFDIQCEHGSNATEYEPFREPQILTITSDRPITKWDRLVEQGGQIGWLYGGNTVVLDGSETWVKSNTPGYTFFSTDIKNKSGRINTSLCKTYKNNGDPVFSEKYEGKYCIYSDHPTNGVDDTCFKPPNETVTTTTQWKEWLAENPIEICYQTQSKEFVPLPESEQNAIRALKTYYPTTVITADGGEVDPDIKVTYRKEI
ncbi:hypothetical protein LIQ95_11785 [[Ruminococcus] gnavus]|uniref:hypothetical protein n=1 Tax=Mediterraneibacter gnavus TaxID=33038 RepID=UPI001D03B462|nr:hypothetical protein [Mediterraneibacter gnavus]MCB5652869.1 hypothetical protein [Mediterraneibacter gnavus]